MTLRRLSPPHHPGRRLSMKFGLFGAATAQRGGGPDVDSAAGFKDYIDYVIEAESLGYESAFIVEHHFTGFGQGYRNNEFASFRIPMEEATPRFEEAIDIITKSWVTNERWSFEGRFWQF